MPTITPDEAAAAVIASRDWGAVAAAILRDECIELRIKLTRDRRSFGLSVPAPSVDREAPWEYMPPESAEDWAQMLWIWLDEEFFTGAPRWARLTEKRSVHYFQVEPYGLHRADDAEHERLLALFRSHS